MPLARSSWSWRGLRFVRQGRLFARSLARTGAGGTRGVLARATRSLPRSSFRASRDMPGGRAANPLSLHLLCCSLNHSATSASSLAVKTPASRLPAARAGAYFPLSGVVVSRRALRACVVGYKPVVVPTCPVLARVIGKLGLLRHFDCRLLNQKHVVLVTAPDRECCLTIIHRNFL